MVIIRVRLFIAFLVESFCLYPEMIKRPEDIFRKHGGQLRMSEATLRNTSFLEADLRRADLSGTNLSRTSLAYANLEEADYRSIQMMSVPEYTKLHDEYFQKVVRYLSNIAGESRHKLLYHRVEVYVIYMYTSSTINRKEVIYE